MGQGKTCLNGTIREQGKIPKDSMDGSKPGRGLEMPSIQLGFERSKLLFNNSFSLYKSNTVGTWHACCKTEGEKYKEENEDYT